MNEYILIDDHGTIYFEGTYWECDEWRECNCRDASYIDDDDCDIEMYLYDGKQIHIDKKSKS